MCVRITGFEGKGAGIYHNKLLRKRLFCQKIKNVKHSIFIDLIVVSDFLGLFNFTQRNACAESSKKNY